MTLVYNKSAQSALAAMTRLAEVYDRGKTRLSAVEIAESRQLHKPFVAKLLSVLSQAGLVAGSRGPGGGYALARDPKQISLFDIIELFERQEMGPHCLYGSGPCHPDDPCPLHKRSKTLEAARMKFLSRTTLEEFRRAYRRRCKRVRAVTTSSAEIATTY